MTSQEPHTQHIVDPDVPDTEVILVAQPAPVFVDATGRRRRLLRRFAYGFGAFCMVYGGLISLSLAGGPVSPSAVLPFPDLRQGGADQPLVGQQLPPTPAPIVTAPKSVLVNDSVPRRGGSAGSWDGAGVTTHRAAGRPTPATSPTMRQTPTVPTRPVEGSPTATKAPTPAPSKTAAPTTQPTPTTSPGSTTNPGGGGGGFGGASGDPGGGSSDPGDNDPDEPAEPGPDGSTPVGWQHDDDTGGSGDDCPDTAIISSSAGYADAYGDAYGNRAGSDGWSGSDNWAGSDDWAGDDWAGNDDWAGSEDWNGSDDWPGSDGWDGDGDPFDGLPATDGSADAAARIAQYAGTADDSGDDGDDADSWDPSDTDDPWDSSEDPL